MIMCSKEQKELLVITANKNIDDDIIFQQDTLSLESSLS